MDTVDLLLTGRLLPGADPARAAAALAQMAGLPQDRARALLSSGKPRLAKRGLAPEAAEELAKSFAALGIETALRPASERDRQPAAPAPPEADAARQGAADDAALKVAAVRTSEGAAPSPGAGADETPEEFNPYAPTKARLIPEKQHEGGVWNEEPAEVSAMRGFEWFKEAWELFAARPKVWIGPLAGAAVLFFAVCLVPRGGGSIAVNLILPVLAGGIAMTAHRIAEDEEAEVGNINPFADRRACRALVNISLSCVLYQVVALVALLLLFGPRLLSGGPVAGPARALPGLVLLAVLVVPQYLLCLFSPCLVTLAEMGAIAAMKKSIQAGIANWRPLLLNALVMVFVGVLGFVLIVLISSLTGDSNIVLGLLSAVYSAPLWMMFTLMSYFAARDIFYE